MTDKMAQQDHVSRGLMDWMYQHQESILSAWLEQIRQANLLWLPEEILRSWLPDYLAVFLKMMESGETPELAVQLLEATVPVLENGVPLPDIIATTQYLSHAVAAMEASQSLNDLPGDAAELSFLKEHVIQTNASLLADLIGQSNKELTRQQERTATLLRVAKTASSSLDLEKVLRCISEEIIKSLDAADCNSFLFPDRSKYGNYYLIDPASLNGY